MEISVRLQLVQLAVSFASGMALGFVYDILRVIRRRSGKNALADALFSLTVLTVLFVLGMSIGGGALNWAMAVFAALGFAFYMAVLSTVLLLLLNRAADMLAKLVKTCMKPVKKVINFLEKNAKSATDKLRTRYTMMKNAHGGDDHEENAQYNRPCDYGADALRYHKSRQCHAAAGKNEGTYDGAAGGNRNRRKGKRRPAGKDGEHRQR